MVAGGPGFFYILKIPVSFLNGLKTVIYSQPSISMGSTSVGSISTDTTNHGIFNPRMQRADCMHYSMSFSMRLEHPWIWVFVGGPGTNSLRISRNNSIFNCLHHFKIAFLALRQNYTTMYNVW